MHASALWDARIALVVRLLARSEVGRVRWPAWEIEEAVGRVAAGDDMWARAAKGWVEEGPFGVRCPGIGSVLSELIDRGMLVHSNELSVYVVDQWSVGSSPSDPGTAIDLGATWLVQRDQASRASSNS